MPSKEAAGEVVTDPRKDPCFIRDLERFRNRSYPRQCIKYDPISQECFVSSISVTPEVTDPRKNPQFHRDMARFRNRPYPPRDNGYDPSNPD